MSEDIQGGMERMCKGTTGRAMTEFFRIIGPAPATQIRIPAKKVIKDKGPIFDE